MVLARYRFSGLAKQVEEYAGYVAARMDVEVVAEDDEVAYDKIIMALPTAPDNHTWLVNWNSIKEERDAER